MNIFVKYLQLYLHYIDDVFIVWSGTAEDFNDLCHILQKFYVVCLILLPFPTEDAMLYPGVKFEH